jgi:hypothetical protein
MANKCDPVCRVYGMDGKETATIRRLKIELNHLLFQVTKIKPDMYFPQDLLASEGEGVRCEVSWESLTPEHQEFLGEKIRELFQSSFGISVTSDICPKF